VVDDLDLGGEVAIGAFLQFDRQLANADVIGARHVDVGVADPLDPDHLASANRHDALRREDQEVFVRRGFHQLSVRVKRDARDPRLIRQSLGCEVLHFDPGRGSRAAR